MAQGTILNYFILGGTTSPGLLFGGSLLALVAIFSLAYSDTFDKAHAELKAEVNNPLHPAELSAREDIVYNPMPPDLEGPSLDRVVSESQDQGVLVLPAFGRWVYICFLAGCLCGLWSPLSTLGMSGEGSVTNPYVVLFVFMSGQVTGFIAPFHQIRCTQPGVVAGLCSPFPPLLRAVHHHPRNRLRCGLPRSVREGAGL